MTDLPPPISHLGRYDIVRVLGQGAMGVVYEGRDPNLDRRVAIKTVRVVGMAAAEIAEYEQRFKTEARSAGRLQHPNIVSVYDSNKHVDALGQTAYIVMEFVQGEDLKHFLDQGKRFSLEQTAFMMADLLSALDYAHKHKIIHRDIKPANMLLTKEGRIKLTDFGVARITDSGEATKTSGGTVGTLKYMSPEQVAGKGVDSSSDLFSAGIVLYQLLTGVRPFDGEGYLDIVSKIVKEDPMPPSRIVGALPPSLDAVVAKALAKSKLDRFADAAAFAAALKAAVNNADLTITPSAHARPELASSVGTFPGSMSGGTSGSTVTQELELVYWKDIKESTEPEVLEGFLKRFPVGIYADLAKRKLKSVVDAEKAAGDASRYEATMLRKPGESTMVSSSVGTMISGAVTTSAAQAPSEPAALASTNALSNRKADDPTLPPSAYNDSEYGASTQFAPTQFPMTEPGSVLNASGAIKAKTHTEMEPMPLEADLVKSSKHGSTPKKSSKTMLFGGIGAVLIGVLAFVLTRGPAQAPNSAVATLEAAITATTSISPAQASPTQATQPSESTLSTPTASSHLTTTITTTTATPTAASPASAASAPRAGIAARAASAARVLLPSKRSSAPEPVKTTPTAAVEPPVVQPTPSPAAAPSAPTPTPAPVARGASGPREACEGRILFGYQSCMAEQCERAIFRNRPVCVERREMEERRKSQEQSR
jgi:eukaryotic-like serine/threonine-protein kinase